MNIVKTEFFCDDNIILKKNNKIINARFGDLIDSKFNFLNSEILTLDENKELSWYNINHDVEEHYIDVDLIKIETKNGFVNTFPLKSRYLKSDSSSIDDLTIENVENIKINDYIPIIKFIPTTNNYKIIKITDYIYEKNKTNNNNDFIYDYICPNDNKIKNNIKFDSTFISFIAFFFSLGYIENEYDIFFDTHNIKKLDEFDKVINQFCRNLHINFSKYEKKYLIKSNILSKFLRYVTCNQIMDYIRLFDLENTNRYLLSDFFRILFKYNFSKEFLSNQLLLSLNIILDNMNIECELIDDKLCINNMYRNMLKKDINDIETFDNVYFYVNVSNYINFDYIENGFVYKHDTDNDDNKSENDVSHAKDFCIKNKILLTDDFIWFIANYCNSGKITRIVDKNLKLFGKKYIHIKLDDEKKLKNILDNIEFDFKLLKGNEYYIISDIFVEFINKLIGDNFENKKIPDFVYQLSLNQNKIFTNVLLSENTVLNENIRDIFTRMSKDLFNINVFFDNEGKILYDENNIKIINNNNDIEINDFILISKYVNKINHSIPNKIIVDDLFSCILGIFYSIGNINNNTIDFKIEKDDFELDVNFKNFVEKYNLESNKEHINNETLASYFYYFKDSNQENKYIIYSIKNEIFIEFLKKMSEESKGLPKIIFGFDKFMVKVFLKNWIKYKGYTTTNENILNDVSTLLKYFNIFSIVKDGKLLINKRYKYIIEEIYPLCEMDLFNDKDEYEFLNDAFLNEQYTKLHNKFYNDNLNIPVNNININEFGEIENVKTYNELNQIIKWYEKKSEKHNISGLSGGVYIDIKEDLKYLNKIYNSHIYMDKIVKIELIENKDIKYLYRII